MGDMRVGFAALVQCARARLRFRDDTLDRIADLTSWHRHPDGGRPLRRAKARSAAVRRATPVDRRVGETGMPIPEQRGRPTGGPIPEQRARPDGPGAEPTARRTSTGAFDQGPTL